MKKYIILFLIVWVGNIMLTSCFKSYLDKAPEAGLNIEQVFSKFENFKKFFDGIYSSSDGFNIQRGYPFDETLWSGKATWESLTDFSDEGRIQMCHFVKSGQLPDAYANYWSYIGKPILKSMFVVIRECNISLKNIGMLKDAQQEDIDDFTAQAHFLRAFAHFTLFKLWGPMPYLTNVIGPYDPWDIPRLSKHETLMRIAADMDTAVTFFEKANRMRRDPVFGQVGHLNSPDQFRPNGVAAKAIKARALLYAASPLNNEHGITDWEEAAKANWEAIQVALQYGYDLLTATDYKKNYIGTTYTNEQLWGWYVGTMNYNTSLLSSLVPGVFAANQSNHASECPTQNSIDKFETKWGDPLNTQADRNAAAALGHYNEQDPYVNRDPRFYIDVIYNQAPIIGYTTANIYYEIKNGAYLYSELLDQTYQGITHTGYYNRKRWGDQSVKNQTTPQYTDPIIRLGELYLNYAEAANEAYGPNTPAPGATMTAIQAINKIRGRWTASELAPVQAQFTISKDAFRPRIKNERTIELAFEGSYFFDIRRWMDAPQAYSGPLIGVDIEKVPVSSTYPTGFRYTRVLLSADRQTVWKPAMYYWVFMSADMYKMKNFVPNPLWN